MMQRLDRMLGLLAGVFAIAGGGALLVLAGVTGVAVFFRYVLRAPIFGIEDVTTMALTVLVAAAIAWAAVQKGHVSVNIIASVFGRSVTRVTDVFARLVSFAMLGIASYALVVKGSCGMPCGAMTSNLGIIHTPFYFVLGGAMAFYALFVLVHLIVGLQNWHGADPNEMTD